MKKALTFLFFLIPLLWCNICAQTTVDIPGYDTYLFYNSSNSSYGSGRSDVYAGLNNGNVYRTYIHWANIKSYVPLGAQIQSVTISISFQPNGSTSSIEFHDFVEKGDVELEGV
jgi:hypothetical protein